MSDIDVDFICVILTDYTELIENTFSFAFSPVLAYQLLHGITEDDSPFTGLGGGITASEIG